MTIVDDPFTRFREWWDEAAEPTSEPWMVLATASAAGQPSARVVLLRGFDRAGFVFYTNLESRKGSELTLNPQATLLFFWPARARQLRIEGRAARVADEEADAYFASRPREAQLGAWASRQSQPLDERATLLAAVDDATARFVDQPVARPAFWSGFRLAAERFEFWSAGAARLHDRDLYTLDAGIWRRSKLYP